MRRDQDKLRENLVQVHTERLWKAGQQVKESGANGPDCVADETNPFPDELKPKKRGWMAGVEALAEIMEKPDEVPNTASESEVEILGETGPGVGFSGGATTMMSMVMSCGAESGSKSPSLNRGYFDRDHDV